jgi:hypothetical protein
MQQRQVKPMGIKRRQYQREERFPALNRLWIKPLLATALLSGAVCGSSLTPVWAQSVQQRSQTNKIYVILTNPLTKDEGIHSISYLGNDNILMFESERSANIFLKKLLPQLKKNVFKVAVESFPQEEILTFCRSQRYVCQIIPEGVDIEPPTGFKPGVLDPKEPSEGDSQPLSAQSCDLESSLRSTEARQSILLKVHNRRSSPIKAYWIDYQGRRQHYFDLAAGDRYEQQTFVTHPWIMTMTGDNQPCLGIFQSESVGVKTVTIY